MAARWQGTIALLLLIIISYVDRVNISVMILNPEFAAHFHLNENRMLQGMLMTCFLLGYGLSALILTPLKPGFNGDLPTGAALGFVRQIEIFEFGLT